MTPITGNGASGLTAADYEVGLAVGALRTFIVSYSIYLTGATGCILLALKVGLPMVMFGVAYFLMLMWSTATFYLPSGRRHVACEQAESRTATSSATVIIDDHGVSIRRELGTNAFEWRAIRDVRHNDGVLHFTTEHGAFRYLLPDRWFDDPAAVRAAFFEKCPQQGSNLRPQL